MKIDGVGQSHDEVLARSVGKDSSLTVPKTGTVKYLLIVFVIAIGAIYIDESAKMPVFPDLLYCVAGAGTFYHIPESTRTSSWRINPGGRDIPNGWTTDPERITCLHETMWKGWKKLYEERLGASLRLPSISVMASSKVCHASGSKELAGWVDESVMTKPDLAKAFGRCLKPSLRFRMTC